MKLVVVLLARTGILQYNSSCVLVKETTMLTAQELRSKRQQHKMTPAQLAQAAGIEVDVIVKYEKGESPISAEHDKKLQDVWRGTMTARAAHKDQKEQKEQD